jgi:ribonucleoside-diphosphate reductase alpha chain
MEPTMPDTTTPETDATQTASLGVAVAKRGRKTGLQFFRHFTTAGVHPYDELEWELRDAVLTNWRDGSESFAQRGVEFPTSWSMLATTIVSQKYFRGSLGTPERESSVRQLVDRVVDTITAWGGDGGYFIDQASADTFNAELKHLLVNQKAAFNSPVWFNCGVEDTPQCSACFILSVEDTMGSILNWYVEEGMIFKGGSGAGINLSSIRSTKEILKGGGEASGPVSFMRGADASAGTIKSGGKTRRAAKMVILNVDHPDIEEFVGTKVNEEKKIRALREAGFDMDLDGADYTSVQFQNANNSVRVNDDFMNAYLADKDYDLRAVATGEVVDRKSARQVMRSIAEAAWECADPGMQYDTVINDWHTSPEHGRIHGSNPCSEYMHLNNSACNLASLNLKKFYDYEAGRFDVVSYQRAIEVVFAAQEIIVGYSSYPTEPIAENAKAFRQLGIGYANLGGLLMSLGLPYDSDEGRAWCGALTAVLTGHAYRTSAMLAAVVGAHEGYAKNAVPMQRVIGKHRDALSSIDAAPVPADLMDAAKQVWDEAYELGEIHGYRNAQASVLAPTGTIGLMMDCDTTGIEPDLGLVKVKKMVGGASMQIVNQTVPQALAHLGYTPEQVDAIIEYIDVNKTIHGAPGLKPEHVKVFQCAMGDDAIHYNGHVDMMAAAQPFISGAISKTVNLPEDATVEEVELLYVDAWKKGLKAVAIYRDNCKVAQPLSVATKDSGKVPVEVVRVEVPTRTRLGRVRGSRTTSFEVGDSSGYMIAGSYDHGAPGELFLKLGKQGSTLSGLLDGFAIAISLGLQYGVPLQAYAEKFMNMRFEPAGMTNDPDIRMASSLLDYVARRMALDYLPLEDRQELGVFTAEERIAMLDAQDGSHDDAAPEAPAPKAVKSDDAPRKSDAPMCFDCGVQMNRAGACHVCPSCASSSGCS